MEKNSFKVEGGHVLQGEIRVSGAKNEALQVICASILTEEKVTIHNIPEILDVMALVDVLRSLGVKIEKTGEHSYTFRADGIDPAYLDSEEFKLKASQFRGVLMLTGPLVARYGRAVIPKPGGDKIGIRPIDAHLEGLKKLGVEFVQKDGVYEARGDNLTGAYIHMIEPSVTGTANIIMAAIRARGTTTIFNAACEPYIKQLCTMLVSMGAHISGIGTNRLDIEGVETFHGCEHTILPDMIEIGSFIGMAAMVGNGITIKDVHYEELGLIPDTFRKLGITVERKDDDIYIPRHDHYEIKTEADGHIITIYDHPWPGLTPDLLSIILVTAIHADGSLLVHQKMFESRLFFVDKLVEMGAQIILCDPHRAVVIGLNRKRALRAITMASPDIRAGMALLVAALSTPGTSTIQNIHQIDRGYEKIDERLRALGAHIERA